MRDIFGRKRTIPVGIAFGTVSVLDDAGVPHEITTFRRDVRTDGRHAEVEFGASLDDDLARRDFTINAIAYRPRTGEVRDPFGGQLDIDAGIVRAVGDPEQRMREDRLRALRAIRFAARYGFVIDPATFAAIRESAHHLTRLSAERVQQELVKTMAQVERPSEALRLWRDTGALGVLVPELAAIDDIAIATLDHLARDGAGGRNVPQRTSNRIAALFLDHSPSQVREAMQALRFSKHETNWATGIAERWADVAPVLAAALESGNAVGCGGPPLARRDWASPRRRIPARRGRALACHARGRPVGAIGGGGAVPVQADGPRSVFRGGRDRRSGHWRG